MERLENRLKTSLDERVRTGNLRELSVSDNLVDFVSNDYLGLARNHTLYELIRLREDEIKSVNKNGSTGSRLLADHGEYYLSVEKYLAGIFRKEKALLFNAGYQANLALLSTIAQKGDTILYDQLSHICLKEGAWLSKADSVMFGHNDMQDLERKLKLAHGNIFVVVESVYSMDGDKAPMQDVIALVKKYDAHVIVDEAHSTGVMGEAGSGFLTSNDFQKDVFAAVYTFGKGMGIHGACVAGSKVLIDYLINFGRPFIYTTSMPMHSVVAIEQSFQYLASHLHLQFDLEKRIDHFKSTVSKLVDQSDSIYFQKSDTAIQPVVIPGNEQVKKVSLRLKAKGVDARAILSPTVKSGTERLRICLHTFNTPNEIEDLLGNIISLSHE